MFAEVEEVDADVHFLAQKRGEGAAVAEPNAPHQFEALLVDALRSSDPLCERSADRLKKNSLCRTLASSSDWRLQNACRKPLQNPSSAALLAPAQSKTIATLCLSATRMYTDR